MSWRRIKRSLADDLFSKYIRARENYTCQRCHRYFENGIGLDNSHYWGRGNWTTRFDPENCDAFMPELPRPLRERGRVECVVYPLQEKAAWRLPLQRPYGPGSPDREEG